MMGPFMAIIRPIAAIFTAITAGILVGADKEEPKQTSSIQSCCAGKAAKQLVEDDCCNKSSASNQDSVVSRLKESMTFTFVDLIKDISLWLIIGLVIASMVKTYIPTEFLTQWGDGFMAFTIMALIGVPMYICALASTPIAAGLLFSGVSPGATLVFMLVGPATNVATIGLVRSELGGRALLAYLGSVIGVGFAFGYLTNYLVAQWQINFLSTNQSTHVMPNSQVASFCALLLAGLIANALRKRFFG